MTVDEITWMKESFLMIIARLGLMSQTELDHLEAMLNDVSTVDLDGKAIDKAIQIIKLYSYEEANAS